MLKGQFRLWPGTEKEIILPNNIVSEGELAFFQMLLQGDNTIVAAGGNFYLGLCGDGFTTATTLATVPGEPSAANGYARQAVSRNSSGWPVVDLVNGKGHASTLVTTFTANAGPFDTAITRAFLCNAASGAVGTLFSISAALPAPYLVTAGTALPVAYDLFLN